MKAFVELVRKHCYTTENSCFVHYRRLMEILGEVHNVDEDQNIGGGHSVHKTLKLMFSISKD